MQFLRLIFILSLFSGAAAQAQVSLPDIENDAPLTEESLISAFKGQTHRGTYSFKRQNFRSFGFEETTKKDGTLEHVQDNHKETGTYEIKDDLICYTYDENERGEFAQLNPICFNIYQRGNCYYHYSRSIRNNTVTNRFSARSVIKGESPDCAPHIS